MSKVALLGLGLMGRGMALNVLKAGYELGVWNRFPGKAAPLVDAGYGVAMAHELDCAVPAFAYAADLFARTVGAGLGAWNEGAIQCLIENG